MLPDNQPIIQARKTIGCIASKEISLFFSSPIAYLFLGAFAGISLFVFFWGEAFFSRNIADIRPLFEWMPILLIFLCSTLSMRLWSEERRTGTLEHVLTQAVPLWHFVLGKFLACLLLLMIALLITLPLPVTVSLMGDLDWGPIWAGYLAALLLGAAYLSIGLFISARSDNQIVSLISACALSGLFYVVGTPIITDFLGNQAGEWLRLLGSGSRFDSITRGVIDIRDLYYYLSIVFIFLMLNILVLEKERWVTGEKRIHHRRWYTLSVLVIVNVLGANLWLGQLGKLRIDMTEGNQYSISEATKNYLSQLQEPLLLRGYFSSKTHPLLSPLVPQLRDLIREYEIAGNGKIRVEVIDPVLEPELEQEANQKYGIQPVPFQVADRYQSSIVSSYFNVLVQYGDEHQVLGFRDFIEIQARSESDIDVQLRNPEHDLTRAIKKVLHGYQAGGNLFDTVKDKLTFTGYFSDDSALPDQLKTFKVHVNKILEDMQSKSSGRFSVNRVNPDANGGEIGRQIEQEFGFKPMSTSLFSQEQFYFYMTLNNSDQIVQLPLDDMTEDSFKRNLDGGIKRFASGFTKTVAFVSPEPTQPNSAFVGGQDTPRFSQLESFLGTELNVTREDLSDGSVSGEADILVLVAPNQLDEKQLFAVDQFLMQGGTVIAATSPYRASFAGGRLGLQKQDSGLSQWLSHHGLTLEEQLVLDPQNTPFPLPLTRNVGGFQIQEVRMLDYPYFIDIRGSGLNQNHLITSQLPQATLTWASPITIDKEKLKGRQLERLLHSSDKAWLSSSLNVMPQINAQGLSTFKPEGDTGRHLLGVVSKGRFDSYFSGKPSPLIKNLSDKDSEVEEGSTDTENNVSNTVSINHVIERSPESARIILVASNDFLSDQVLRLSMSNQTDYLNTLQMIVNAIDWSLEDAGLLSIRSRGHFNRTLPPMEHNNRLFWEYLNYGLAVFAIIMIALWERRYRRLKQRRYVELFSH
ncbi:ABC transporter permease [Candidatus Endobugula sertula]|uniref:ABC transporter permease n=1 Tax=Candidatus Endobugula sertula TaxID=62101 RepID=A0A1D2QLM2_9GAMM|nr:ABC transporter permease [Candidatus Endobugula sertula]